MIDDNQFLMNEWEQSMEALHVSHGQMNIFNNKGKGRINCHKLGTHGYFAV
jgi:hypothetical protein